MTEDKEQSQEKEKPADDKLTGLGECTICTDCKKYRDDGTGRYRCKCTHRKYSHV